MTSRKRPQLVLAIYFQTTGFGFVLLDGWFSPIDWGVPEVQGNDRGKRCLQRIDKLLSLHTPDMLVLEDMTGGRRRAERIKALNRKALQLARKREVPVHTCTREQVFDYFEDLGGRTKHRIAEIIAQHIPALGLYIPPPRKPWKSADPRMGIFDAAALVWTYFWSRGDHVAI